MTRVISEKADHVIPVLSHVIPAKLGGCPRLIRYCHRNTAPVFNPRGADDNLPAIVTLKANVGSVSI